MESMDGAVDQNKDSKGLNSANGLKGAKKSKATLWLVMAVCVLPVVLSTAIWWSGWSPAPKMQAGTLIQPVIHINACMGSPTGNVAQGNRTPDNQAWPAPLQHKWVLLAVAPVSQATPVASSPSSATSSQAVLAAQNYEKIKYLTQQLKTMQGKHRSRVARAEVNNHVASSAAAVQGQENELISLAGQWCHASMPENIRGIPEESRVYVIDPHGNVMMVLDARATPKALHKDLTRLLTVSRIG